MQSIKVYSTQADELEPIEIGFHTPTITRSVFVNNLFAWSDGDPQVYPTRRSYINSTRWSLTKTLSKGFVKNKYYEADWSNRFMAVRGFPNPEYLGYLFTDDVSNYYMIHNCSMIYNLEHVCNPNYNCDVLFYKNATNHNLVKFSKTQYVDETLHIALTKDSYITLHSSDVTFT